MHMTVRQKEMLRLMSHFGNVRPGRTSSNKYFASLMKRQEKKQEASRWLHKRKALDVFSREDMHPTKFDILIFWFEGIGGCNRSIGEIRKHLSSSVRQSSSVLLQYETKIEKEKQ